MSCYFSVPLGSIPELPAETCKEIKASEGGQAVSAKYWFDSIIPGETVFAHCDMKTEGILNNIWMTISTGHGSFKINEETQEATSHYVRV